MAGLLVAGLATGCSVSATPTPEAASSAAPSATTTIATVSATPTASATPTPSPLPATTLTDTPVEVDGIAVVSKDHRLTAAYVPPWADEPHGLHPDAAAAFATLQAAAKADGLTLTIRSGYRSYAAQQASFDQAMKRYSEETARRYYAEAGASEHQTGLSLDAWDGHNRGSAFAATDEAAWLAEHAHEYGFIIRYPPGQTDITGSC